MIDIFNEQWNKKEQKKINKTLVDLQDYDYRKKKRNNKRKDNSYEKIQFYETED